MSKKNILILFAVLSMAQLAIPAKMILERELTLSGGEHFKFRTAPVDPYDAFRGRYVSLQVEMETQAVPLKGAVELRPGDRIYLELARDENGFAKAVSAELEPPGEGLYITARVRSISAAGVFVDLPLDRYYLPEDMAPRAERAYIEHSRLSERDTYIEVRIRSEVAVIENLYVGGKPIREYLIEQKIP